MNSKTVFRAHPVYIYKMLKRFLFVLVLPVLKGAVQYVIYRRVSGVILLEGIALAVITALSVWRLLVFRINAENGNITITDGVILQKRAVIPRENISSITVTRHLLLDLINAATVSVNTEAGIYGKKDFSFKLYIKDAARLEEIVYGKKPQIEVRFPARRIALLSATASSSLTSLIVGAPVINRIGRLLNVGFNRVLTDITDLSKRITLYFPPVVNAITIVFAAGYGLAFLISLSRNFFFRFRTDGKKAEISSGLYFKHKRIFNLSAVKNVCLDQTPLMRLFKTCTMRVGIGGYGGENGEKSTVVPAMNKRHIKTDFTAFFPQLGAKGEYITCKKDNFTKQRFLALPNLYAIIILGVTASLIIFLPSFERLFLFAALVGLAIDSYYGYISVVNHRICGVSLGETVAVKGVSNFTVRELYVDRDLIGKIKITRTPLDLRKKTCRMQVTVRSESSDSARVRNLPYRACAEKIEELYGIKP